MTEDVPIERAAKQAELDALQEELAKLKEQEASLRTEFDEKLAAVQESISATQRGIQASAQEAGRLRDSLAKLKNGWNRLPIGPRDDQMRDFLEHWLDLRKKDGTMQEFYDHWILGKTPIATRRRWCVIRDVLEWVD